MSNAVTNESSDMPSLALRDVIALTKPGILIFSLLTTAGAMSLAPGTIEPSIWIPLFVGCAAIVASANSLNMYMERVIDGRMARTKTRPLPAGRMQPVIALVFGLVMLAVSMPVLFFAVNPLTGLCGVVAFVSYISIYTPLKQRTTVAIVIGSLPGAMPALMGWTAVTGQLDIGGLVIFGVLFFWQIPHFHAITLFRSREYSEAGFKVLPVEGSTIITRVAIVLYSAIQIQLSLMLYPLGVAGPSYTIVAGILGVAYFAYALLGLRRGGPKWARKFFLFSLVYIPVLFSVMVLDGI